MTDVDRRCSLGISTRRAVRGERINFGLSIDASQWQRDAERVVKN